MTNQSFSKEIPNLQVAWDATSLRPLLLCPRRYYYEIVRGFRHSGATDVHLVFGHHYHSALEIFDKAVLAGEEPEAAQLTALRHALTISRGWESDDTAKNRRTLVRAVVWYTDNFIKGDLVQPVALADGTPAVELSFALPLLEKATPSEEFLICGHLDGLCEFGGDIFVRERKTTKTTISQYYFKRYLPDARALGADFAERASAVVITAGSPLRPVVFFCKSLRLTDRI